VDFSIVIPSYRRPGQLADCLRALERLDYAADRFEVIVVDDGNPDPLEAARLDMPRRLQVRFLRRPNGGPGAARNTGVEAARGRFVAFTDDDCAPAPDWLKRMREALEAAPGALVGGRTCNALGDNPYAVTSQLIVDFAYEFYKYGTDSAGFFATNNMALPAADFRDLGGFDPCFRTSEDRDFCDRWTLSGRPMRFAPEAIVHHAHRLTLGGFLRQHFHYGRGARQFYLAHRRRGAGESTLNASFYGELLRRVPATVRGRPQAVRVGLLLLAWQAANTAGFLSETVAPGANRSAQGR